MRFRSSLILFGSLLFGTLAIVSFGQEMLYLELEGDLAGYSRSNWSYKDPPDIVLPAGAAVPVQGCLDTKSDLLLIVSVESQDYFVGAGEYRVLRRRATPLEAWFNPRATFVC